MKWTKLVMGSRELMFLKMQPHLVPHLKLVRDAMLVVSLFVFGIRFFQTFMDLFLDVLNHFKKLSGLVGLILGLERFLPC